MDRWKHKPAIVAVDLLEQWPGPRLVAVAMQQAVDRASEGISFWSMSGQVQQHELGESSLAAGMNVVDIAPASAAVVDRADRWQIRVLPASTLESGPRRAVTAPIAMGVAIAQPKRRVFALEGDYLHDILWKITEGWRGRMAFYCTIYGGGIHLIDLMRWLVGREVETVCGLGTNIPTRGSSYRWPDTFMTLLRFEGGALGKCLTTLGPKRPKFHALSVFGTKRTFVNGVPDATLYDGDDPATATAIATSETSARLRASRA